MSIDTEPRKRHAHAGQPTKYTPAKATSICRALAFGAPFTHAARAVGVNPSTARDWMVAYPAFADRVDTARAKAVLVLVRRVFEASTRTDASGNSAKDLRATQWMLTKLAPGMFGDATKAERLRDQLLCDKLKAEIALLDRGGAAGVNLTPEQFDSLFATKFGQLPGHATVEVVAPVVNVPGRGDAE